MIESLGYATLAVGIVVVGLLGVFTLRSMSDIRRYLHIRHM